MHPDEIKSYHSYRLQCQPEESATPEQAPHGRFILQDVSDEGSQKTFGTIDQVINYLLDELRVPNKTKVEEH